LKRLVERIRRTETQERDIGREYREFKRENSAAIKRMGCLRTRLYNARRRAYNLKRVLGLFTAPGLELPPLLYQGNNPHY
jgi:hypothetical protein